MEWNAIRNDLFIVAVASLNDCELGQKLCEGVSLWADEQFEYKHFGWFKSF